MKIQYKARDLNEPRAYLSYGLLLALITLFYNWEIYSRLIYIHDGQIFILRGEKTYTVTGQEVR